jgi:hypothetical protein
VLDGGRLAGDEQDTPQATEAPIATLQHGVELLAAESARRGDQLDVTLTWRATRAIPGDFTVFVHLLDQAGHTIAQGDGPPRDGYWPTSLWQAGEVVTSTHTLTAPPDHSAQSLSLGVGMYDPATQQRLFAYRPDGSEWRDWMVLIGEVPAASEP